MSILSLLLSLVVWLASPAWASTVTLTVVGSPATGPWGVEGKIADIRDVMTDVKLDGVLHHTEHTAPYGFPDDNGLTATTGKFGNGSHVVEFIFKLEGTTTEIGRASITVVEGVPQVVTSVPGNLTIVSVPSPVITVTTATLSWPANAERDLAGYHVYRSTTPGMYGAAVMTVGAVTTVTVTGLTPGTHYFTITAYDQSGNESGKSNEVSKLIQ